MGQTRYAVDPIDWLAAIGGGADEELTWRAGHVSEVCATVTDDVSGESVCGDSWWWWAK
jgi:hypothetical protein